jgi:uncharacterized phiE125 gp8 family phage protein
MPFTVLSPAATAPVPVETAKAHLRVTHDLEDALIADLIAAATARIEAALGVAILQAAFRDDAPVDAGGAVTLSRGPLVGIDAAVFGDGAGAWTALDPARLVIDVDAQPPRVAAAPGANPGFGAAAPRLRIDYRAGVAAAADAVPPDLVQAVLALVAAAYAGREADPPAAPSLAPAEPWLAAWRRVRL